MLPALLQFIFAFNVCLIEVFTSVNVLKKYIIPVMFITEMKPIVLLKKHYLCVNVHMSLMI